MNKQPHIIKQPRYILCLLVLIISGYPSFAQKPSNADSSKTKKQSPPPSNSTLKNGYAKITLLGHKSIVKLPALQDSDGDGVPDQFDFEPNTPCGAEVDTHGRALDTDGDGVPDFIDKEPNTLPGVLVDAQGRSLDSDGDGVPDHKDKDNFTNRHCFPVDSNVVGTCPAEVLKHELSPDDPVLFCCATPVCNIDSLPSIRFEQESSKITRAAAQILVASSLKLMTNPYCNVRVCISAHISKKMLKLQKMRVDAIIKYFIEKTGLLENRFKIGYDKTLNNNDAISLQPCVYL